MSTIMAWNNIHKLDFIWSVYEISEEVSVYPKDMSGWNENPLLQQAPMKES